MFKCENLPEEHSNSKPKMIFKEILNIQYQSGGYSMFNIHYQSGGYSIFRCQNLPE